MTKKRTAAQAGRLARAKGLGAQREYAKLAGGAVCPGSGGAGGKDTDQFSNDVHLPNGWQVEVKRFATGEKTLYGWLMDNEKEKPDYVAFRADNRPWVAAITAPKLKLLIDIQMAAQRILDCHEDGFPSPAHLEEYQEASEELKRLLGQAVRKREG